MNIFLTGLRRRQEIVQDLCSSVTRKLLIHSQLDKAFPVTLIPQNCIDFRDGFRVYLLILGS